MISLSLVTAPAVEPLDLEEARRALRVDLPDEDGEIADVVSAARAVVEERTQRKLLTQTWDYAIDAFPRRREPLVVPFGPLQSVTSITVYDATDAATTWSASNYVTDTRLVPGRVVLAAGVEWPRDTRPAIAAVVRFVCGSNAAAVPSDLRHAIKLVALTMYERRPMTTDEERALEALVAPWVVSGVVGAA